MIAGYPPFYDEDITNTYKKILTGRFNFPPHFSTDSRDIIRKLLQVEQLIEEAKLKVVIRLNSKCVIMLVKRTCNFLAQFCTYCLASLVFVE